MEGPVFSSLKHTFKGHQLNILCMASATNTFCYGLLVKIGLTHWGRVTYICVSRLTITGSDNGLSPGRRQAIIWTSAGILLIGPLGTNFSENLIKILTFSYTKMRLKVSSVKWRPFCLGLNVLKLTSFSLWSYCRSGPRARSVTSSTTWCCSTRPPMKSCWKKYPHTSWSLPQSCLSVWRSAGLWHALDLRSCFRRVRQSLMLGLVYLGHG